MYRVSRKKRVDRVVEQKYYLIKVDSWRFYWYNISFTPLKSTSNQEPIQFGNGDRRELTELRFFPPSEAEASAWMSYHSLFSASGDSMARGSIDILVFKS